MQPIAAFKKSLLRLLCLSKYRGSLLVTLFWLLRVRVLLLLMDSSGALGRALRALPPTTQETSHEPTEEQAPAVLTRA